MGWVEAAGMFFKFLGQLLDMKAKNTLTREGLDAAVAALKSPPAPKTAGQAVAEMRETLKSVEGG